MAKYKIIDELKGKVVWTALPKFVRKGGARFELNVCTQDELKYLFELGIKGIIKQNDKETSNKATKSKNISE